MENSDSEYETEETVVLVELNGIIDADLLLQEQSLTKILGIDTDEPLLQIGNCLFKGEYEDTLGTVVLYEPVDGAEKDGLEGNENGFKFLCKTDAKLTMKRCFPQEKSMDNLKPAEVSPVAIQNEELKESVTASKMKTLSKKEILHEKKRTKPMPKKLLKSKKNTKKDHMDSVEKRKKKTVPINETTQELNKNITESTEKDPVSNSGAISTEVLNLQKGEEKNDQRNNVDSGSLELPDDKKKKELPKKRKKRDHDEADGDKNTDSTQKKLMKVEAAEVNVQEKETKALDKENKELDSEINNVIETDRSDEQMVEVENITKALDCRVTNYESKTQEKGTTTFPSQASEAKLVTEESIQKSSKNTVTADPNESSASSYENQIQEKDTTAFHSETSEGKVVSEESTVKVSENTVTADPIESSSAVSYESKIQEKNTTNNTEIAEAKLVLEESIEKSLENTVTSDPGESSASSYESKIQEKDTTTFLSENTVTTDPSQSSVSSYENKIQEIGTTALSSKTSEAIVATEETVIKVAENTVTTDPSESSSVSKYESKIQEKETTIFPSETSKTKVVTEESIITVSENTVTTDPSESSASNIDGKKNSLIEECVPMILDDTSISNESEIQEKNTVVNISEVEHKPLIEESITKTVETIVGNIESEITEDRASTSVVEVDESEELTIEDESVVKALDNTSNDVETVIQEGGSQSNISDGDNSDLLAEKNNDDDDLVLGDGGVKDNGCSSSSDMVHTRNEAESEQMGICESSDGAINLDSEAEILEKIEDNASSCEKNNETLQAEGVLVEESNLDEKESNIASDNIAGTSEEKDAIDAVSQSASVDECVARKSESKDPGNTPDELLLNAQNNLNPVSGSDKITPPVISASSGSRKRSSCEVTQSTNSDGEPLENKDLMSEYEVFSAGPKNDSLEKSADEYSEPPLESSSTASEISQSCPESKLADEASPVEFVADGAMCSQSTDQAEVSTDRRDLCISSCDIDVQAEYIESTENEMHPDLSEDVLSCSVSETNVICEVSQSDESENNIPVLSESTENEAKMLSNECDESFSNTEENLNDGAISQHLCEITGNLIDAINVPSTSSIQEVTQSCSIKDAIYSEESVSNESDEKEASHVPRESLDNKEGYDCVSSVDEPAISETLLEIEADSEERDPNSEVSQSFRPAENLQFDETREASYSQATNELEIEEPAAEFKHPSEVSQSVESEDSTSRQSSSECQRTEHYSVEYRGEICESSDDASNIGSNFYVEEAQTLKNSMCEVSQSFGSERTALNTRHSTDSEMESSNECEVYATSMEPEAGASKINMGEKTICESSDDVIEVETEVVMEQVSEREKDICESSDDVHEIETEVVIDQVCENDKNICESSDDVNETESEIVIVQIDDSGKHICESSDDINETEPEIIIDQPCERDKNICESSDDINETESEIIIDYISDGRKIVCESSDDINETESKIIIDQLNEGEKNVCESSDDVSENLGSFQQHTVNLEEDISDEACQSSKFDENTLSASETEVLIQAEENLPHCETSVGRSNKHSAVCESSEDTISMGPNDQEMNSDPCTSSDKSVMVSSDTGASLLDKSSDSAVTVGDIENNQISQSSNIESGFVDMSVNGTENSMISQSGNSANISTYKTPNESENSQISQSGGYSERVSVIETESEVSQSGGVAGASEVVTLNETENNQISQSGCVINSENNVVIEETENDQISQSESTVGCLSDSFVTEAENNQISQSGNSESALSEIALNEVENSQISQSGAIASCSADVSIPETENNLISQSGSVPVYSSDVSRAENENSQISQSGNPKEFLYEVPDNNQISQSSSSSNLPSNVLSRETGNNQISQSGNSTDTAGETESNQICQSSSSRCTSVKESENYQISQSSSSCGLPNVLPSSETENNLISQSECDDVYQLNETLPSDSTFQAEVVNVSSSSDVVSSNYVDVTNSSFHVSNSAISSNSEVSASLTRVRPHIWDRNSLVTSVTTSEMRISVLSSEQRNVIESQSAQTSAHLAVSSCSGIVGENVTSFDQEMSSSNNVNEVVESSLPLIRGEEVSKSVPKDDAPSSVSESVVKEMPSTSQNVDKHDKMRRQNIKAGFSKTKLARKSFQSSVSGNSHPQKQFEFDPSLLPTSFLPRVSSQSKTENKSSSTRPSFLEVMASSASDFRNSLLSDNSFGKDKSHPSSAPEPSGSNVGSRGEFSESFIREADGLVRNRSSDNESCTPEDLSTLSDKSDPTHSEVPRSSGMKRKYSGSSEFGYSHHQVSQSSDVVNTLSSTSRTHAMVSDNISQSSQQDFVQSSSNVLRTSVLVSNDSVSLIDQVSSADENTSFVKNDSGNTDISESSIGVEAALPSCSQNTLSLTNSNQLIESSSDQPAAFTGDGSGFKPENTESEVSSTPSETQYAGFKVVDEGKNQFSVIQGSVIILPGTSNVINESDVDISTVEVTSPDGDYAPVRSNLNSEAVLILDSSNEAETLNRSSVSSPIAMQLASFDQAALSMDASQARIVSGSPSGVEAVNYEESSEVSESLMTNQNDISQSSLGDNNVSCSVSEFSTSHRAISTSYSFPDISQEAESKSSDDCISSYHSTCDNILPVPNLQSSADREFYSHVGEFDDSVQSSLDETHLAINEQIKAISSPANSSDSASCEEQRSLSLNPFATFSSQSHVFSTNYGATSSKITLSSNSASEIGLEGDNLIEGSPQVITTSSNNDIIISSFDPELTTMSQSPQNSGNACSPEQYVELSEQIVPAVQMAGADFVESSNDQLDDSESVETSVPQNIVNTDSES